MPGPWSRTVSSPSRSRTSTVAPGGLHLAALSSRFATARSSRARSPRDHARLELGRERHRRRVPRGALDGAGDELVEPQRLERLAGAPRRRARARRGRRPARRAPRAGRRGRGAGARGRPAGSSRREPSTSRLVRSEVSGVRSSCDASATSWRCARWESSSASSIVLNDAASRASSSSPVASIRRERSRVRATCSAVSVRSVTGRTAWRVAKRPRNAASAMPASATRPSPSRSLDSALSTSASGRATCSAVPSAAALVKTRTCAPSTFVVGEERRRAGRRRPPGPRRDRRAARVCLAATTICAVRDELDEHHRPLQRLDRRAGARAAAGIVNSRPPTGSAPRSDASIWPRSVSRTTT